MIDISTEQLLTLADAAKLLPGRPSSCAIWRWRTKGVRGRKLESLSLGGRVYTSREALQRFARQEGGEGSAAGQGGGNPPQTPHHREKAILAAEAELAKAGI